MSVFGPSGGTGGYVNAGFQLASPPIGEVVVRVGNHPKSIFITSIEFIGQDGVAAQTFGGDGIVSTTHHFHLQPNEHIMQIIGKCGHYVDSVRIVTNTGRSSNTFGGTEGGTTYDYNTRNEKIVGLWGRSGAWIDAIGVYAE